MGEEDVSKWGKSGNMLVKIPPATLRAVRAASALRDVPMAVIATEALTEWLRRHYPELLKVKP